MTVKMTGGTSGCRHDYLPPASPSYDHQEPQNTATDPGISPMVQLCQNTANGRPGKDGALHTADMPTGGTPDDSAT